MDEIVIEDVQAREEAEYNALVARLDQEFPPVSGKGFDFSKIRGNFRGKTAKAIVLHLSCVGWSIADIAEATGASCQTVGRYLANAIYEASPLDDVEVLRQFELRKCDVWEQAANQGSERSFEDAVITREQETKHGTFTTTIRKGQSGNPAWHRILLEISKRRSALVGMDKPTQVHVDKTERKLVINEIVVKDRKEVQEARVAGLLT